MSYIHWKAEQGWNMAGEMEDLGTVITAQQFSSIKTHSTEILIFNWIDFLSNWRFFHGGHAIAELLINRQIIYRRRLCLSCSLGYEKFSVLWVLLFGFQSFRWTIFIYLEGRKIWDHTTIISIYKHTAAVVICRQNGFSAVNSTGEGTGVQQAHAQLDACHWLSSSPWSSHFLHIPQCNSTVRELYRFHITDDRNRILYNLICKFYSEQLKTNKQKKKVQFFVPTEIPISFCGKFTVKTPMKQQNTKLVKIFYTVISVIGFYHLNMHSGQF